MENSHGGEPDLDLYTIPSYSSWFQWNSIHEVERLSLREFFDGSSITRTPRIYKEYRDFIISKYREDPTRRLTFTDVRKSLVGDVSVLQKVFTFLEKWSLINFSGTASSAEGQNKDGAGTGQTSSAAALLSSDAEGDKEDDKWKVRIEEGPPFGVKVVAGPNSLKPVVPLPPLVDRGGDAVENGARFPPLASYSDIYGELLRQQAKGVECGSCKEGALRHYKYSKEGNFILCEKCFKNGNYEKDKAADDFEFIDSSNHDAVWTEAETLLLLESVLKHGDDWELVAQNVKTKSKMDCISKLIQLPFGDIMLGSVHRNRLGDIKGDVSSVKGLQLASACSQGTVEAEDQGIKLAENQQNEDADNESPPRKRVCTRPMSDASSSLLKQIAHICQAVGPHITASVGDAAISALCYENQCSREIFDEDDDFGDDLGSLPHNKNEPESVPPVDNSDGAAKLGESESQVSPSQKNVIPLTLRTRAAASMALGAAAARAKILADQEEREMEELVATIIENQLKKMHHKMRCIEDLELLMENQHAQMEEVEESLVAERISLLQRLFTAGFPGLKDHPLKQQTTSAT